MGSGIYSIGVSALQNAQLGLATTSHNIANASTEGYNRQRIIQATNVPVLTGAGYVGQGAHVSTIERVYSSFISKQINSAQAEVSSLEAYSTELTYLNNVLSDTDSGLSTALESFFTAVQQVSSDPSSLTTRQTLVSSASALTSRFQGLSTLIEDQYESVNNQIQGVVASINSYSQQIATLNKQIINAESATGQPPNDLYDQRDQLLLELNKLIGATASTNTDGSYNVYFGNGQPLVVGTTVTTLTTKPSAANPQKLGVAVANSSGTIELPESVITGGSLSGLMEYRSSVLDEVATRLDEIADALATTFNAQHALGQDLQGNAGGDFFTSTLPSGSFTAASITVNPDVLADVRLVAAAAPVLVSVSSDNTGSATVSAGTVSSGYSATPVTLEYVEVGTYPDGDLTGFPASESVTVTVDGSATDYPAGTVVPYKSGATYTTGGVSFTVSGAPDDGDQIVIELNTGGVSDNRNMLLLGSLQTAKTMAGGTATYATVYSQLVSYAGAKGAETETKLAAQTSLLTAAEERREELSGVNLDEEAVNLLKYQQEYQAAAKMLQIASELFDAVLNIR